jgi:protein involved in polysaccharide export with SLBB domain
VIHDIGITREVNEFIEIYGSVKKPGRYTLTRNMTLTDVLMLAEGYTEDAWTLQAEIARLDKKKQVDTLVYIRFSDLPDLKDTLSVNDFNFFVSNRNKDFQMQHRDKIFIRPDPNFRIQQMVSVNGEINYSGSYALVTHNEYLTELIKRAGGATKAAYLRGGALFRSGERVNVDFQEAVSSPKSGEDIILHESDSLYIPKKPNSIKVGGEVNNPSIIAFNEGKDLRDYIKYSGGLRDSADYIVLYHPNGTAERFGTGWFGGNSKVYDGSTIYVTKVPTPPADRKELDIGNLIRDIFAITASALTILVLAKSL